MIYHRNSIRPRYDKLLVQRICFTRKNERISQREHLTFFHGMVTRADRSASLLMLFTPSNSSSIVYPDPRAATAGA